MGLGVFLLALFAIADCENRRKSCKDAPLADGCSHPDQRFTVVAGKDMCLCARDGGAK